MSGEVSGPSQKARDYAAGIADECNPEFEFLPDMYRDGKLDGSPLAQAFARFEAEIRAETPPADADVGALVALREACAPFLAFDDGRAPESLPITVGSSMARKQLTIGDCRRLAAALFAIGLGGEKG